MSSKFPEEEEGRGGKGCEEKIEGLTREISRLIGAADEEGRAELRDYAIGLLREETETTRFAEGTPLAVSDGAAFNPLGLAIPLFLVGGVLLPVFPPVGGMLLATALVMAGWGTVWMVLSRSRGAGRK